MSRDFVGALLQLNAEKGVPREQLILTIADAIESAYRRIPGNEDVRVRIDPERGEMLVTRERRVVDVVEDPLTELTVDDARAIKPDAEVGEEIVTEQLGQDAFGRIGAQTAKQVVLQRLREAERDVVYDQFASREGDLITGTVNRVEPRAIILDLGKAEAILATTEQSPVEHYRIGQNVKAFVLEVRRAPRGPQVLVSRTHKGFLRRLFELEVPEIHAGTVEIKAIAREPGSRSKVAVASRQEGLDPVGATVGQRGARVQAVVAELAGEKIDVIEWSEDPAVFVAKALSPAQVVAVHIDEEHRIANVVVPEKMLSLAIGREGQNARLAAKMTGWRIDIRSDAQAHEPAAVPRDGARRLRGGRGGGRGRRRTPRTSRRRRWHRSAAHGRRPSRATASDPHLRRLPDASPEARAPAGRPHAGRRGRRGPDGARSRPGRLRLRRRCLPGGGPREGGVAARACRPDPGRPLRSTAVPRNRGIPTPNP